MLQNFLNDNKTVTDIKYLDQLQRPVNIGLQLIGLLKRTLSYSAVKEILLGLKAGNVEEYKPANSS